MKQNQLVFIIDAGNTSLKLGIFEKNELLKAIRLNYNQIDELKKLQEQYLNPKTFISSVLSDTKTTELQEIFINAHVFSSIHKLPIQISYQSETLGKDRICNAVAAANQTSSKYTVVVDIGTCIKFDVVNNGNFIGGSISPGINLRYKSLHEFTGKLPLINNNSKAALIGASTESCIHTGVMLGLQTEIESFMNLFSEKYKDLTFFVTGGDSQYFDLRSKNNIFADENLTLKGLYLIYRYNAK